MKIKEAFNLKANGILKKCPKPIESNPLNTEIKLASDLLGTGIVKLDIIEENKDLTLKEILNTPEGLTLITDNQILFKYMQFGCEDNIEDLENEEDMNVILNSVKNILNNKAFSNVTCTVRG